MGLLKRVIKKKVVLKRRIKKFLFRGWLIYASISDTNITEDRK